MRISTLFSCQYLILNFPHRVCTYENIDLLTIAHCFLIRYARKQVALFMLLSGKRTDALCFCVQSLPLAERLQLKGQLRAAHNGVMVVVKVFVVIAGQRTGFLRRDDAELGENREDGIRDDG